MKGLISEKKRKKPGTWEPTATSKGELKRGKELGQIAGKDAKLERENKVAGGAESNVGQKNDLGRWNEGVVSLELKEGGRARSAYLKRGVEGKNIGRKKKDCTWR